MPWLPVVLDGVVVVGLVVVAGLVVVVDCVVPLAVVPVVPDMVCAAANPLAAAKIVVANKSFLMNAS
jgi:hypothetical protein